MSAFSEQIAQILEERPGVSVSLQLSGGATLDGALRAVWRETISIGAVDKPIIVAIAHIVSLQIL